MANQQPVSEVPVRCECGYPALDLEDAERHVATFGHPGHSVQIGDE